MYLFFTLQKEKHLNVKNKHFILEGVLSLKDPQNAFKYFAGVLMCNIVQFSSCFSTCTVLYFVSAIIAKSI